MPAAHHTVPHDVDDDHNQHDHDHHHDKFDHNQYDDIGHNDNHVNPVTVRSVIPGVRRDLPGRVCLPREQYLLPMC